MTAANLSCKWARSLDLVGVTAHAAMRAVDVKPGDAVVVAAAAGGVASALARLFVTPVLFAAASFCVAELAMGYDYQPAEDDEAVRRR
jgi:hypothetical protein